MSKLFVFAIGGTGSRVLRSLTMTLAAGTKLPGKFDTIVPIIVDPDSANGDMNRTTDILLKYQNIKNEVGESENFFNTKIKTLSQLSDGNSISSANHFMFKIAGTSNVTFEEFIGYQSIGSSENKALIELLFTEKELNANMDVGFKGKPNIGSVVLNQIIQNDGYQQFANKFDDGDAIFIISSIFGGTGAAGFPLILKNLRTENPNIPNSNLISEAIIGAISYLPYFKITPPQDENKQTIDSSTFLSKAQSALYYYEHAIFGNDSLNAFYYTSDNSQNDYEHHDGKAEQKNNAHFLELAGALAIVDFLIDVPLLKTVNKKSVGATSKEYGVTDSSRKLRFNNLGSESLKKLQLHLSKFALTEKFLRKSLEKNLQSRTTWIEEGFTDEGFFSKEFYERNFSPFLKYFKEWMDELENNDISFSPFSDSSDHSELLNYITGYQLKNKRFHPKPKARSERLTENINKNLTAIGDGTSKEAEFVQMFDKATELVVKEILNT